MRRSTEGWVCRPNPDLGLCHVYQPISGDVARQGQRETACHPSNVTRRPRIGHVQPNFRPHKESGEGQGQSARQCHRPNGEETRDRLAREWCGRVQEVCDIERHLEFRMRGDPILRTP